MYRNNISHEGRKEQGALAATTATRPSKSNRFMKQNNTLFCAFLCRHCTTTAFHFTFSGERKYDEFSFSLS